MASSTPSREMTSFGRVVAHCWREYCTRRVHRSYSRAPGAWRGVSKTWSTASCGAGNCRLCTTSPKICARIARKRLASGSTGTRRPRAGWPSTTWTCSPGPRHLPFGCAATLFAPTRAGDCSPRMLSWRWRCWQRRDRSMAPSWLPGGSLPPARAWARCAGLAPASALALALALARRARRRGSSWRDSARLASRRLPRRALLRKRPRPLSVPWPRSPNLVAWRRKSSGPWPRRTCPPWLLWPHCRHPGTSRPGCCACGSTPATSVASGPSWRRRRRASRSSTRRAGLRPACRQGPTRRPLLRARCAKAHAPCASTRMAFASHSRSGRRSWTRCANSKLRRVTRRRHKRRRGKR
mmetsp:Transcript_16703/g.53860  ORF Transcript_16703/g.53860 Transcript_16703/m.53860 type:complete len:353 (-) Transcript_16703:109-1167(-)